MMKKNRMEEEMRKEKKVGRWRGVDTASKAEYSRRIRNGRCKVSSSLHTIY